VLHELVDQLQTAAYTKRGQMERDLLLCMKRRERREQKKPKTSRESDAKNLSRV
jgi:hypothetical protein